MRSTPKSTLTQEEIILSLIQGEDGNNWKSGRIGWILDSNLGVCIWGGVDCNSSGEIIAIVLTSTDLSASIPTEFGMLSSLQILQLGMNSIYGSIPSELAKLSNLEFLNLSQNRITGSLPDSFESSHLRTLDLHANAITGFIPSKNFVSLSCEEILLGENLISGTIPEGLYQLSKLDTLDLSSNLLSGSISESIGDLILLRSLYLNDNFFIGSIPSSIAASVAHKHRPLDGAVGLQEIWLNNNALSGSIPVQLSNLPKLRMLYINDNKLTGEIPPDLCSQYLNADFFRDVADIDRNYCNAIGCPSDFTAINRKYPCEQCFNLHHNPYIGQTGPCATAVNQRDILKIFYQECKMHRGVSDDDNKDNIESEKYINWMEESTFLCDFTGVTCDINYHVTEINLPNYGLHGTIPTEIGFLPHLEVLNLADNDLVGNLPSDLRWAPLKKLDISGNRLKGEVPPTLCAKAHLNGNGQFDDFNCDHIACPAGLYSPSGIKDLSKDEFCEPCHHLIPHYLAYKDCNRSGLHGDVVWMVFALLTLIIVLSIFYWWVIKFYWKPRQSSGGITLYEFVTKESSDSNKVENDAFMDDYIASAGSLNNVTHRPYSDNPVESLNHVRKTNSTIMGLRDKKEVPRSGRNCIKNLDSTQGIRQPVHMKEMTPKHQEQSNGGKSIGGKSIGSGSSKCDPKDWLDVPIR